MIDWCRSGPAAARVDELLIDWEDFRDEFDSFEVHR
jgi:acylphosphatase